MKNERLEGDKEEENRGKSRKTKVGSQEEKNQ